MIDAWATSDAVKAWAQENNIDLGETVVDEWDRSFVGLDYEQVSPNDLFREKNGTSDVKVWDFCNDTNNTKKVKLNGQLVDANTVANDQLFFPDGEPVKWVDDNTNMYLGQNLGTNQNTFNKQENGVKYYDLDAVYDCINQGAYPKLNNMEFIKGLGGRDYIFSDWIVTLTPAKKFQIEEPEYDIRIIAEDLNATKSDGDSEDSDFDFNDVVFDVKFLTDNTAKIRLVCAGGTLPIRLNGDDNLEVHKLFGISDTGKMINTGAEAKFPNQAATVTELPVFDIECQGVRASYGKNIEIEVQKIINGNPTWIKLQATAGQPAAKMGVMPDFTPCTERQSIKTRYTRFVEWVNTTEPDYWWRTTNE